MRTVVFCTLQFQGVHCWPDCPIEEVAYLRQPHRHMFHVRAVKEVHHDDRDVEFIQLKSQILYWIHSTYPNEFENVPTSVVSRSLGHKSCETIAKEILTQFDLIECEVNEDGENGAIVYADNGVDTDATGDGPVVVTQEIDVLQPKDGNLSIASTDDDLTSNTDQVTTSKDVTGSKVPEKGRNDPSDFI